MGATVRSFFRFCAQSGWIQSNPAALIKSPRDKDRPTLPFTSEQITASRRVGLADGLRGIISAMSRQEVVSTLQAQRAALHERFGVARLLLFGSVARDEAVHGSDVDLLVEFDRPVGLFSFLELQEHLETLLGCAVDLGTPHSLKPRLRDRVLAEAVSVV